MRTKAAAFLFSIVILTDNASAQKNILKNVTVTNVDSGWAGNSINTVVFRKNSLVTYGDFQFIGFYNKDGDVILGKRKSGNKNWELIKTNHKGNIKDAHNDISIMIDGAGYLHMAWNHHTNPLNYSISKQPLSLEMSDKIQMTSLFETSVTYPEFYKMPDGDLLFLYRDGASGKGNLVINKYSIKSKQWRQLHSNLIDGENKRNAYWQACVDNKGIIHISWVWRESSDVSSNHDMCYARSTDGGVTWERSTSEKYSLPITAATAEYVWKIPQKTELINQTSMCTDANGNPYIASYWREEDSAIPQYHILFNNNNKWNMQSLDFRKTPFSLSGGGTKRIPISRPHVIVWNENKRTCVGLIFKDEERNNKVSVAINDNVNSSKNWKIFDLTSTSVGSWEPTYDTELWKKKKILNLFVQKTEQTDAEGISGLQPQMIQVIEWKPGIKN
ncbi:MAG: neuraminidase [Bacteroidetes bacterium]|nr:MAG: neuraminidase [Bacteroidota bacterium]